MSEKTNKLVLLSRSNPMCPQCVTLKNMLADDGLEYEEVDIAEHPEAVEQYKISSVPVSLVVNSEGEEVMRFNGVRPPSLIKSFL